MSQEELGRRLEPLLGKAWPRQAVWAAERGQRAFTAAELLALATALETTPGLLITPHPWVETVETPGGASVPVKELLNIDFRDPFLPVVNELTRELSAAVEEATKANERVRLISEALVKRTKEQALGAFDAVVDHINERAAKQGVQSQVEGEEE